MAIENVVLSIIGDKFCNVSYLYIKWIINLATSCHVTLKKELFTSYKVENIGRVKMMMIAMLTLWDLVIFVFRQKLDTP